MKLIKCRKPDGNLVAIDTPLNVRGQWFQSYRKDYDNNDVEYFEHNQTKDTWMRLEKDLPVQS